MSEEILGVNEDQDVNGVVPHHDILEDQYMELNDYLDIMGGQTSLDIDNPFNENVITATTTLKKTTRCQLIFSR